MMYRRMDIVYIIFFIAMMNIVIMVKVNRNNAKVVSSSQCSYTLVVNEVTSQKCPRMYRQRRALKRKHADRNKSGRKRPLDDDSNLVQMSFYNAVRVRRLEGRLRTEVWRNKRLNGTLRSHEIKIGRADEMINGYRKNITELRHELDTVNHKLVKHHRVTRSLSHKISSMMLDLSEVNHMLSKRMASPMNNADPRSKYVHVRSPATIQSCGIGDDAPLYKDCQEIIERGHITSGLYYITPTYVACPIPVWCDMDTTGGGWLVIQRRSRPSIDFRRDWSQYKRGFGDIFADYWLGNDNIFLLTNQKQYTLRVDLWDFSGNRVFAAYLNFKVDGERDLYRINVSGYSGSAGDSLGKHDGSLFSTFDFDNDKWGRYHCAKQWGGGWWYGNCWVTLLNGEYHNSSRVRHRGISWNSWKHEQLAKTEMKIRPVKKSNI